MSGEIAMPVEHLVEAQQLLQKVQALAAAPSPARLEKSQSLLEGALRQMQLLRAETSKPDFQPTPAFTAAAQTLQRQLQHTQRLLEQANLFFEGWARLKASLTGGYDAHGNPAPAEEIRRGLAEA